MTLGVGDLPKGFDLDKYASLATLSLDGWAAEIFRRLGFALAHAENAVSANYYVRDGMRDVLAGIVREPVRGGPALQRSFAHGRFLTGMRSMTVQDARFVAERVKDHGLEAEISIESMQDGESRFFDDAVADAEDRNSDRTLLQWLGVDVDKPTVVLEREFRHWLKAAKGARSVKRDGDGVPIPKWIEDRLLPCFDLVAYAWSEGETFSDDALFSTLFPDDLKSDDGARRMRQTIRPKAKNLVSFRMYDRVSDAARRAAGEVPSGSPTT